MRIAKVWKVAISEGELVRNALKMAKQMCPRLSNSLANLCKRLK
ncbi:MAG: hypothetical protein ACTS6G_00605 [Candidatus Hodgkinia cicadicola]